MIIRVILVTIVDTEKDIDMDKVELKHDLVEIAGGTKTGVDKYMVKAQLMRRPPYDFTMGMEVLEK
jgi:hypothetical protein